MVIFIFDATMMRLALDAFPISPGNCRFMRKRGISMNPRTRKWFSSSSLVRMFSFIWYSPFSSRLVTRNTMRYPAMRKQVMFLSIFQIKYRLNRIVGTRSLTTLNQKP